MLTCYFRSLFENTKDGMIQSGCITERPLGVRTTYLYIAGSYAESDEWKAKNESGPQGEPQQLDYLVLGAYTINCLCRMLNILSRYRVGTMILPYLTPMQRLVLAGQISVERKERRELLRFLDMPYRYLKSRNVEQVYFLYENGRSISDRPDCLVHGEQFEPVKNDIRQLVNEMEGCKIPLVKAGYVALNEWMFYFGVYGPDIRQISQFVREELEENDLTADIREITGPFLKKFGEYPYGSVMMYHGPLYAVPKEKDSLLTAKVFQREQKCGLEKCYESKDCTMKCMHEHDYDIMQGHKNKETNEGRFGVMLTGNVNMRRHFSEVAMRFWKVRTQVRVVTLPNCGAEKYWNPQLLQLFQGRDIRYWVCPIRRSTGTRTLLQIVTESSFNRLIQLNYEYGFCLSGFLANVDDEQKL